MDEVKKGGYFDALLFVTAGYCIFSAFWENREALSLEKRIVLMCLITLPSLVLVTLSLFFPISGYPSWIHYGLLVILCGFFHLFFRSIVEASDSNLPLTFALPLFLYLSFDKYVDTGEYWYFIFVAFCGTIAFAVSYSFKNEKDELVKK